MLVESVFDFQPGMGFAARIKRLTPESKAQWGKMSVGQMLAHMNASFEFVFEPAQKSKPGIIERALIRLFVKPLLIGSKPFKRNLPTKKELIQTGETNFEKERTRLLNYLQQLQALGEQAFDGKVHVIFGTLTASQWDTLFSKHLDHHLRQFNV